MKVNGNQYGNMNVNPYKKQLDKVEQAKQMNSKQTDKIEISKEAQQMQQKSPIEAERQEKVEAIKKQVESGTYKVDPQLVAKKMVDFWFKK
ncbi:flagellar biosynthesis anti-sigma factor FlgM [Bacillus marinisedimentorum]|uniref:flagellar biosynthesis anti-sigma factor FlgM n=1 Tax=Bacillus marinisedimentorum TaxID=1821260 RepID=UPI0007DFBB50|nr:flagellar biosynthesis anti-sigma factor FlgM [Bacillus marinisedimentorum]